MPGYLVKMRSPKAKEPALYRTQMRDVQELEDALDYLTELGMEVLSYEEVNT
ncbi:MAG: hypothetical protein IJZ66_02220 [Oscillibacter sp.]|nr:hypothetical protein [Oscillibacter sp.]